VSMVERHAAAIRRNLAIPGGEAAVEQIFAEFVHVHGGDPRDLMQAINASSPTCGAPRNVTTTCRRCT